MAAMRPKPKIRAPRRGLTSVNNEVDFEGTWEILAASLRDMHTKNASKLSFEMIYRHAYKIVLKKKGDAFYERLQDFEKSWLKDEVRLSLTQLISPGLGDPEQNMGTGTSVNERRNGGERFLRGLRTAFEDHQIVMNMATDVFMYLDRAYVAHQRKLPIYTMGMMEFRDCILKMPLDVGSDSDRNRTLLSLLNSIILEQIAMERDGDIIDKTLIKGCVTMLESLYESSEERDEDRLYSKSFEKHFLNASRKFYEAEATKTLAQADAATYCRFTLKRIAEEQDRCRSTLSESTWAAITSVVEDELVSKKMRELVQADSGVRSMIDNDRFADLGLMYDLNSRIDDKKSELTAAIQRRIIQVGATINEGASGGPHTHSTGVEKGETEVRPTANQQTLAAIQWVDEVLQLKDKHDQLWKESLQSDKVIQPAITESFKESINAFPRCAEFVSLFIDENMKKGLKDKTEAEVDVVLEKAIVLLRYLQDRDMFERYYKKHLCKRLLMGKSISIDWEKSMISRMKIELGNSFTSKMEQMFKDMTLSESLTNDYRSRAANSGEAKRTELGVSVLTSMTWPLETMQSSGFEENKHKCIYPNVIQRLQKGFENFYAQKHSGRVLTWMGNMGTADIKAVFPKIPGKEGRLGKERRHELNVSTYAMIVLMLFNDLPAGAALTFEQIRDRTNIPTNDLIRNLQALAVSPKTRVLLKEPMSKEVSPSDKFTFNESFQTNFMKVKVGVVASGNKVEGEKERVETERKNNEARNHVIEAAVVRIMKQRKELTHQQLIAETLSVLASQFKPDPQVIKGRIEGLIEREYLERIEDATPPAYRYLA